MSAQAVAPRRFHRGAVRAPRKHWHRGVRGSVWVWHLTMMLPILWSGWRVRRQRCCAIRVSDVAVQQRTPSTTFAVRSRDCSSSPAASSSKTESGSRWHSRTLRPMSSRRRRWHCANGTVSTLSRRGRRVKVGACGIGPPTRLAPSTRRARTPIRSRTNPLSQRRRSPQYSPRASVVASQTRPRTGRHPPIPRRCASSCRTHGRRISLKSRNSPRHGTRGSRSRQGARGCA